MTNNYKYFLSTVAFGTAEVFPFGEGDTSEQYQPLNGFIADYRRSINGNLILTGNDFNWLYTIETSSFRCDIVTITIQKNCGGVWADWFIGNIKMVDCAWDPEKCSVKIKITSSDPYTCYENKKETEIDLFGLVPNRHSLKLLYLDSILEYTTCTTTTIPIPFQYWCNAGSPSSNGWTLWKHTFVDSAGTKTNTTYWVREKRTVDCALSLGTPWIFISETCPGSGKIYARSAIVYGSEITETRDGLGNYTDYSYTRKVFGRPEDGPTEIDNGMKIRDILIALADLCSLTVVSNFFQINPTEISTTNYVTGQASKVLSLLAFQKSDIKRPGANANATIAIAHYEKLFEGICLMFNLQFKIEGTTLRLEHCSYFTAVPGIDLTLPQYSKFTRFKHTYTYDNEKLPSSETFKFQEGTANSDFSGTPIIYENDCASSGKDSQKKYVAETITTDLLLCLNNPESDSKVVSDEGIFIAAADEMIDNHYLITEAGILYGIAYPNNSLAWSQLQRDYHRYKRPFSSGKMNMIQTTFDSVIPTLKGAEISIPLCCEDIYDPLKLIETALGSGIVESSSFSLRTKMLKLNLVYKMQEPLLTNDPPIANPDGADIFKNQTIDIDVLANDSDGQGIGSINLVEITTPPTHGTAIVVDKKIRYTPTTNYVGTDAVYYRIRDNFSAYSNTAAVTIQITDPAPVAVNKSFSVEKNIANVIPAPGVMAGDSPGGGTTIIVISNTTPTWTQGVAIAVNPDGSFTYNAPNLVGTDTFDYTIQNDESLSDTGTITLNIFAVPASTTHILSKSNFSGENACWMFTILSTRQNYYSPDASLTYGSILYTDNLLTTLAGPGYYSNGTTIYEITGTGGAIENISSC